MNKDLSHVLYLKLDDERVPRRVFTAVHRFAEWAGIGLDARIIGGTDDNLQYDGHSIGVGNQIITNIIHDIAHHVVAPEWRRKYPNWALGPGPDESPMVDASIVKKYNDEAESEAEDAVLPKIAEIFGQYDSIEKQETMASLLGICVEFHLGLGASTLLDHSWINLNRRGAWYALADFYKVMMVLRCLGLVGDCGRPTFMDYLLGDGG